ncbi:metal ABC transporter permease [Mycoplana ramosa]|uniref:Metal ABC transporter permease n=1 Tax=Mycoplana ramosa TaxID=40837 RepID=A0ABW3YVV1_MYCRA
MSDFLDLALLPFRLGFMQYAFAVTLMIAVPMALLSCYLVLKGWSLMGDAVSHAVLPGVVIAYVVGLPFAVGAFVAGLLCALAAGFLRNHSRVKEDTVLGIVFSGMFGLGIVLYVATESDVHLDHILFGDMLGIATSDLIETGLIALACAAFILFFRKDLLVQAFDRQHAAAIGLPVNLLHYGLLAVLSLVVVGALKAVGIILSVAMLVAPGAIAALLTRRFGSMLATAVTIAIGASLCGIYLSFFLDSAPAPTIVVLLTVLFIAAFVVQTTRNRQTASEIPGRSERR